MSQDALDSARSIREGEELDTEKLSAYLKEQSEGFQGDIQVSQFPSGYSNLTYLLQIGDKEYVLRRPPFGANIKSAHDMGREYKVLSMLKPVYEKVPQPVLYCEDEAVIGGPFYMMERVTGIILRNQPPKGITMDTDTMKGISEACVDNLAALHNIDIVSTGLAEMGKPEGYISRQVEGWIKRYYNAETDKIKHMDATAEWMRANMPEDGTPSFIHNDYKYDNLVLDSKNLSNIEAVLDWEMATVGDPLMDLGTSLGYWGEANDSPALKPFNLTWLPGNLTREEVVERYATKTGKQLENMLFYYVFGSFKIGVIVQQIYARYKKGFTKDPRFAQLIYVVNACADNAQKAVSMGRISNLY
ncbi:MAG: phosphotransferase family protein [Bacteroidota bacterium]